MKFVGTGFPSAYIGDAFTQQSTAFTVSSLTRQLCVLNWGVELERAHRYSWTFHRGRRRQHQRMWWSTKTATASSRCCQTGRSPAVTPSMRISSAAGRSPGRTPMLEHFRSSSTWLRQRKRSFRRLTQYRQRWNIFLADCQSYFCSDFGRGLRPRVERGEHGRRRGLRWPSHADIFGQLHGQPGFQRFCDRYASCSMFLSVAAWSLNGDGTQANTLTVNAQTSPASAFNFTVYIVIRTRCCWWVWIPTALLLER